MAYELKGVWSTIGTPRFDTKEKFDLAKVLAGIAPYPMRWDHLEEYRSCYGDAAVDALDKSRTDDCNGFLVVSNRRDWAFPGAVLIQPDPIPEPSPAPGQVKVQTPFGSFSQGEMAYVQNIINGALYLSPETLTKVIKQLNAMLA
jgi:hypothetical protein